MPRPPETGYSSQVKLLQALRRAQELSFQCLVHATKLHRNTVAGNLKILAANELVGKRREGRYVLYRLVDEDRAWSYIQKHGLKINSLFRHPVAKKISRGVRELGVESAKPRLRQYVIELSKYPDSKPYGSKGIKAAKILRSHLRDKDRNLILRHSSQPSSEAVTVKVLLRPSHLLYYSALTRLSRGEGDKIDWLIVLLTHLAQYKWQNIQYPEMRYLRQETPEEEMILSELNVGDWRRDHEESRRRIQADYAKWKEHEEEYIQGLRNPDKDGVRDVIVRAPLTLIDKKGNIVNCISYFQFKAEERNGFANLRKEMDQAELESLIRSCKEHFKDAPIHYLDEVREMVAHAKIVYAEIIWFISQRYKKIFAKYADLTDVFERINPDIGKAGNFGDCLSEEQLVMEPAAHLKGMQEVMSPWKVTLAL